MAASSVHADPADLTVSSRADKMKVSVGEPLTFSVTISGPIKTSPRVDIGTFEGFQLMSTGQSQKVSINQGQMQLAVTLQYLLLAQAPGKHRLGPVTVEHEGKKYTAPPIQVEVNKDPSGQLLPQKKEHFEPRRPKIYGGTVL